MDLKHDPLKSELGVSLRVEELMAARLPEVIVDKIAEKVAEHYMKVHGARVLSQIDAQVIANLASLRLGAKAEHESEAYFKDGVKRK